MPAAVQCVLGIDVATHAQMVCALPTPSGALRHKASRSEATADGYALLRSWLQEWGTHETILMGMEATGPLGEPLDEDLPQVGDQVLLPESAADLQLVRPSRRARQDAQH